MFEKFQLLNLFTEVMFTYVRLKCNTGRERKKLLKLTPSFLGQFMVGREGSQKSGAGAKLSRSQVGTSNQSTHLFYGEGPTAAFAEQLG